ncbi:MAG: hypothetical protein WEF86_09995 [Gemmatimonadota bacterium]
MSHLSLEALARIVDEPPARDESMHLEACAACRAALDALREDVHALGLLPDLAPPPDAWPALEQRLAAEGLLRQPARGGAPALGRIMQLAAAVVLFLAGSLAGRLTAAPQPVALVEESVETGREPQPQSETGSVHDPVLAPANETERESMPGPSADPAPTRHDVRLAHDEPVEGAPRTAADAAVLLRRTEDLYLAALTRYAELATESEAGDPVARLAALQSIVMTTQAALHEAPTDPVINGYHLTALAQRDATLAQVTAEASERWY